MYSYIYAVWPHKKNSKCQSFFRFIYSHGKYMGALARVRVFRVFSSSSKKLLQCHIFPKWFTARDFLSSWLPGYESCCISYISSLHLQDVSRIEFSNILLFFLLSEYEFRREVTWGVVFESYKVIWRGSLFMKTLHEQYCCPAISTFRKKQVLLTA